MAGIVRKLFKSSGSSKKTQRVVSDDEDDDGDYAELHFTASTSNAATPSRPLFPHSESGLSLNIPITPRHHHNHDQTIDSTPDQSFDQPSPKKRRLTTSSSRFFSNREDSIYEDTQYQLAKWEREETRNEERRKRKRAARHVEQENFVNSTFERVMRVEMKEDVEKLRKERDAFRRDAERYKRKFEELERKYKLLEKKQQFTQQPQPQSYGYQPFVMPVGFNPNSMLMPSTAPPTFLLQPTAANHAPFMAPPPSSSAPFPQLAPSGPMAPRYPDPFSFDEQDDDDTSLSDLSNSSKSDISSDGGPVL